MVKVGIVGLGKMGLSHYSIINAHEDVAVVGVCDSSTYLLDILNKYTGVSTFPDHDALLESEDVEAVVISTPSRLHAPMVRACLERDLHVFCEKPFCLDPRDSLDLAKMASDRNLVSQVGYHNRFVGAFVEAKRLLEAGAVGRVTRVLAEAYGPVVLKPKGATWRSKRAEGGGALYDYAAHPLDLLTWYFGQPVSVSGTVLGRVFSAETEDEVATTIDWGNGTCGQLSVSWSDDSQRKMTTRIMVWGTNGRMNVDRQECQVFLRDSSRAPEGYVDGWNVRYTTDLTRPVDFYVRGEEYSAQLDAWVRRIGRREPVGVGDFTDAAVTDQLLFAIASAKDGGRQRVARQDLGPVGPAASRDVAWRERLRAWQPRLRLMLRGKG